MAQAVAKDSHVLNLGAPIVVDSDGGADKVVEVVENSNQPVGAEDVEDDQGVGFAVGFVGHKGTARS